MKQHKEGVWLSQYHFHPLCVNVSTRTYLHCLSAGLILNIKRKFWTSETVNSDDYGQSAGCTGC